MTGKPKTKSCVAKAQLKSPPELLVDAATKHCGTLKPAVITPTRMSEGQIARDVLSQCEDKKKSPERKKSAGKLKMNIRPYGTLVLGKSPPEQLIDAATKHNDALKPAAVTTVRMNEGQIARDILSEPASLFDSPSEDVNIHINSGMTSGLFGDFGIPSVAENTDIGHAISVEAGIEGDFSLMTFDDMSPRAYDKRNTSVGLGRDKVEENTVFYDQLHVFLYAPADMNNPNEYTLMQDGECRLPRNRDELFRQRLQLLLDNHYHYRWWVHRETSASTKLEEFIVIICHMIDNDAWSRPTNTSDIAEINVISRLVGSLWSRIKRSMMEVFSGNAWRERAEHVDNMMLSLVNRAH